MKYFYSVFLKKNFEHGSSGTTMTVLRANIICRKIFLTFQKDNKEEHLLCSDYKNLSWLSLERSKGMKAEDVIPKIVATIEAKPFYYKCVHEIYADLRKIFPDRKITLFGSSVSNLALENADVDVGMHLLEGKSYSKLPIWSVKNELRKSKIFDSVIAIIARVPIVKCVHHNKISCDISFSEHFGIYDSHLIRFILSIDDRIRPLLIILKFLTKKKELLPNTHCLVVMAIFFLQLLDDPLIPPISHLQNLGQERILLKGWDVSFKAEKFFPAVNNQFSVTELLHKFFQFYADFDFPHQVISVFTGEFYSKNFFSKANSLPEEYQLYKKKVAESEELKLNWNSYVCIQGIFNHDTNISKSITKKHIQKFQKFCRLISASGEELLQKSEEHKLQFLIKLFNTEQSQIPKVK